MRDVLDDDDDNNNKKNKTRSAVLQSAKVPCGLHGAHLTSEPLAGFLSCDDTEILLAQAGVGRTEGEESKIFPRLNPLPPPPPSLFSV